MKLSKNMLAAIVAAVISALAALGYLTQDEAALLLGAEGAKASADTVQIENEQPVEGGLSLNADGGSIKAKGK